MDIFIFSYKKDAELLPICIEQAKQHGKVYLIDDSISPAISREQAELLGVTEYILSTFDRKGNMNGSDCVQGILNIYASHGSEDWIMKLDPDTLLFYPELLIPEQNAADLIGQSSGTSDSWTLRTPIGYGKGSGMLMRRDLISELLELLKDDDIKTRIDSGVGCADYVITILTRMLGKKTKLLAHESAEIKNNIYCRIANYCFDEVSAEMCKNSAAVRVRKRLAPGETEEEKLAASIAALESFREAYMEQQLETEE